MTEEKTLLLDDAAIKQKVRRIAFEIYEQNFGEKQLVLAGIDSMGYRFAQLLQKEVEEISPVKVKLLRVSLDKKAPLQSEVEVNTDMAELERQVVIIADDVYNTGRTLAYSFKPFLNIRVKKLQVAVLVDRGHHSFPVQPDYVGYSLSTTIKDHIDVYLDKDDGFAAYLS